MITYVKGNILDSEAQALVNTVNTVGVMGKGLALQFKERFPDNYRLYRAQCKLGNVQIGKMFITEVHELTNDKILINFPTKTDWRKPSEYEYIEKGLLDLKKEITNRKIQSVAIPPLGSRNGGLNWNIVKNMIEEALAGIDCHIYLYEPDEVLIERLKTERVPLTPARAMLLDVICDMVSQGDYASEFSSEKIAYFLQRFGAHDQFRLQFKQAFYGPYSGKVRYVLRYLNGSYLMGLAEMNQKPFEPIWILPDTQQAASSTLALPENNVWKEISDTVKTFLDGFYSNYSLELLATTDFILTNDSSFNNWAEVDTSQLVPAVLDCIAKWSERKKNLFSEERYISIMIDHLKTWQSKMIADNFMAINGN